jgi:hypothetical protein
MKSFDSDAEVCEWMRKIGVSACSVPLPDPHLIWRRAEILRRVVAERAAMRPVRWMELFAAATCVTASLLLWVTR